MNEMNETVRLQSRAATTTTIHILRYYPIWKIYMYDMNNVVVGWIDMCGCGSVQELSYVIMMRLLFECGCCAADSSTNKPSMAVRNLCDRHNHRRRLRC